MDDLKKTRRITIASVLFIMVLAIAFITYEKPLVEYKLSPLEMNDRLTEIIQITPEEALELISRPDVKFVDIRGIYDFEFSHIDSAINIPIPDLLNKKSIDLFNEWSNDSSLVVLYGKDEVEANASWMLMYQLGYTNTRLLLGGIQYFDKLKNKRDVNNESYTEESPKYDFAEVYKEISGGNGAPITQPQPENVILRKKSKKKAEGGC